MNEGASPKAAGQEDDKVSELSLYVKPAENGPNELAYDIHSPASLLNVNESKIPMNFEDAELSDQELHEVDDEMTE